MSSEQEGFLIYDGDLIKMTEEEKEMLPNSYQSSAIFNPISAKDLDPKDPELLNKMFEPIIIEADGDLYRSNVSKEEASRNELDELEKLFEAKLKEKQARQGGICPIRQQLHNQLFDEIIRQSTINLSERGLLLMRVRDNLKMTFAAYQTLYEGSLVFGNRKAHIAESGVSDLENRLQSLKKKKIELQNKKTMLQNELEAVEQGFEEIKVIEQKSRNDELTYINNQTKRLEEYLNTFSEN